MRRLVRWFMAIYLRRQPGRVDAFRAHIESDYAAAAKKAVQRTQRRMWWCDYRNVDWAQDPEFRAAFARQSHINDRYTELLLWLKTVQPPTGDEGSPNGQAKPTPTSS